MKKLQFHNENEMINLIKKCKEINDGARGLIVSKHLIEKYPNNVDCNYYLAYFNYICYNDDTSLKYINIVMNNKENYKNIEYVSLFGNILYRNNMYKQCLSIYNEFKMNNENIKIQNGLLFDQWYINVGKCYEILNQYHPALQIYHNIKNKIDKHYYKARLYHKREEFTLSMNCYQILLSKKVECKYMETLYNIHYSILLIQTENRLNKAIKILSNIAKNPPKYIESHLFYYLGYCYQFNKHYNSAKECYQKSIKYYNENKYYMGNMVYEMDINYLIDAVNYIDNNNFETFVKKCEFNNYRDFKHSIIHESLHNEFLDVWHKLNSKYYNYIPNDMDNNVQRKQPPKRQTRKEPTNFSEKEFNIFIRELGILGVLYQKRFTKDQLMNSIGYLLSNPKAYTKQIKNSLHKKMFIKHHSNYITKQNEFKNIITNIPLKNAKILEYFYSHGIVTIDSFFRNISSTNDITICIPNIKWNDANNIYNHMKTVT